MSHTPFSHAESLRIGTVEFVSPDEVKVLLDIEAPESVALNAGGARAFPRVNGYLLIPVDDGHLVGQVEWLTIERSAFPKRRGVKDFGLIDLPYPLRKLSLNPLGTLRKQAGPEECYKFHRGADAFPSVGTPVLLPTEIQLRQVIESGDDRRVHIGNSPLAANAKVCVDPDRIFGRHLAVLGNTGSGKSCSVAGLIRWSLEAAKESRFGKTLPNARFIVLDPNGEYSRAFGGKRSDLDARIFNVNPGKGEKALKVPLWFWNSAEWISFTKASTKTQKPTLVHALRLVRDQQTKPEDSRNHELRRFVRTVISTIRIERNTGGPWGSFPKPKSFFEKIEKWKNTLEGKLTDLEGDVSTRLQSLVDEIEKLCVPRRAQYAHMDFTLDEINSLLESASNAHAALGGTDQDFEPVDADSPLPFTGDELLRGVEATAEMMNVSEYAETLLIRLRSLLADAQMKAVIGSDIDLTLEQWLIEQLGSDQDEDSCIRVIDLSLVPSEIVHIVTAVIARIIFEALQRYRKTYKTSLPTVLVMEEAHTFIKRYQSDSDNQEAAKVCCQVFERIAREGRKYGLGLVLSSQRPSELSPTVLSQCNTFLLHRISNDRDQELVNRLVPDNLRGLLRELPALPSQHAILLGWASELPMLVRMNDLPKPQQPYSDDPEFWNVWTGIGHDGMPMDRQVDWKRVADDWQATTQSNLEEVQGSEKPSHEEEDDIPF